MLLIELKKEAIDAKALAQILRYKGDILNILEGMAAAIDMNTPDNEIKYGRLLDGTENVNGLLIGSCIADPDLAVACFSCNISLLTYRYENNQYSFDWYHLDKSKYAASREDMAPRYVNEFGDSMQDYLAYLYERESARRRTTVADLANAYLNNLSEGGE